MQTEVTRLLGIKYPIIQGGMAWVAEYHLAAAVSNAGGLGLIGAASAPADWVREQVKKAKELTDKPFGVNIMLMSPYADEVAEIVAKEGVKVVTTGAGNPEKYMKMWKEAGVKVIPVVASVALAKRKKRSRRSSGGRLRGRRTYRREYDDGACPSDCGCGKYTGNCGRRDCRRQRHCGGVYAGGKGRTDGNAFRSDGGIPGT